MRARNRSLAISNPFVVVLYEIYCFINTMRLCKKNRFQEVDFESNYGESTFCDLPTANPNTTLPVY